MGIGGFVEPAIVLSLLCGGTWVNRRRKYHQEPDRWSEKDVHNRQDLSPSRLESCPLTYDSENETRAAAGPFQLDANSQARWRKREIRLFGLRRSVLSLNTKPFGNRLLSRLLFRFPFLVEVWYWALIYWVGDGPCALS